MMGAPTTPFPRGRFGRKIVMNLIALNTFPRKGLRAILLCLLILGFSPVPCFAEAEDAVPATESEEITPEDTASDTPEEGEAVPMSSDTAPNGGKRPWYRGRFETELDTVFSHSDQDIDFSQFLRLEVDPPKYSRLHLRGSLWLHQDLSSDRNKPNTLRDINDASSSDVQARLLYLYAKIDDVFGASSELRIGRQRIQEGATYNRIDGIYGRKRVGQWEGYAFVGARASLYRDTTDDFVLGGGLAWIPTPRTRIGVDGYYAEESRYGVSDGRSRRGGWNRPVASERNDSKTTLSLWHNFGANTRLFARIGMLGSDVDELSLSLNGYIPRLDLLYDLHYRQLFDTTGDTTADLSPFYQILGQYREHQTLYLGLHRPLTDSVTLSLEGEVRNAENDDFYSGNRDYVRVGTVLYVDDVFQDVDVSTSLEYWDVSGGEGTWTVTGEVSRSWGTVDWRFGVDYVRYKDRVVEYDQGAALFDAALVAFVPGIYPGFSYAARNASTRIVDTRENVYSVYTELEWAFQEDQDVYTKISFEEDDSPDSPYWRIRAGYRLRF